MKALCNLSLMVLVIFSTTFGYRNGDTLKIYFLGNSVTNSGTSRVDEFRRFAAANSLKVRAVLSPYGGWFADHLANPVTMAAIRDTLWDYVVIQGQSNSTSDTAAFNAGARALIDTVRASGAEPLLYITHSYQSNGPVYDSVLGAWTFTMQERINKVYLDMATEKQCRVLPVGFAHGEIRRYHPEYLLYNDYVHSNPMGGYIHGAAIFSAVTGIDAVGLPNLYALDSGAIHAIQCAAWKACLLDTLIPFILPWERPLRPERIAFLPTRDSLECYLKRTSPVFPVFAGDSTGSAIRETIYRSLTPSIATVDPFGTVTALKVGTARIEAEYYDRRDTLELEIVPNQAVYDSIRITPRAPATYVTDGYQFKAVGYSFHQGQAIEVDFTTVVSWISGNPTVFTATNGKISKLTAQGGPALVAIEKDGLTDTVRFTLLQDLDVLLRINFQNSDTVYHHFWKTERGLPYSDSAGYGWHETPYTRGYTASDNIEFYDSLFLRSTSLWASKRPAQYNDTMIEGTYKINCHDGDYIIRMAVGHAYYNRMGYVRYGSDTLFRYTGTNSAKVGIKTDTIQVRGEQGMLLNLYGPICYLIVATSAGVDMDSIAFDRKPLPQTTTAEKARAGKPAVQITAYPNPFNPRITVELKGLAGSTAVNAAVYDLNGREIHRFMKPASGRLAWDAVGFPSGVYVLKVCCAGRETMKRITLLK